ncbi:bacteriocin immunity protein [Pseudomonas sp. CC120222-01a]|uniref:bacteriocin immunity protein n=1 Tax=Pseudomonas sp. CC120222-01a TaxID=1378075 RepID=UPI000D9CB0B0|nr:bacteriocin immunity protein [Pseudomonas sp. CC120222-01a]PVZ42967.1 colicin immunity protein/pyocin immunity protein [Pseudomonas sp. CC120222-01a]
MTLKEKITDYTEAEFLAVITELYENRAGRVGKDLEAFRDEIVINFKRLTEHPNGSDVISYPPEGAEKSPQGVVNRVKEWRAANGKPGFKPA